MGEEHSAPGARLLMVLVRGGAWGDARNHAKAKALVWHFLAPLSDPQLVVRSLEVHVARICTADLAIVPPAPDTNSQPGHCVPGVDHLPSSPVAIGAVHLASTLCGPRRCAVGSCAHLGPRLSGPVVPASSRLSESSSNGPALTPR